MRRSFKNAVRKTLAWVLTFAMVFGFAGAYIGTEAQANDEGGITIYYYYPDNDGGTPAVSNAEGLGDDVEVDFYYWGRPAYIMKDASGELGEGWFSIDISADALEADENLPYFQFIISYTGADITSTDDSVGWIMGFFTDNDGNYTEDGYEDEYYITSRGNFAAGEDVYMTSELTSLSDEYTEYDIDSIVFLDKDSLEYALEVKDNIEDELFMESVFFVAGCLYNGSWAEEDLESGIFDESYVLAEMTEIDENVYEYEAPNMAVAGSTYYFEMHYYPVAWYDGEIVEGMWDYTAVSSTSFTVTQDCYVHLLLNVYRDDDNHITGFSYKIVYYDENGEELDASSTMFYCYYSGSSTPALVFSQAIEDRDIDGYYWGRYCYNMTAADGYDNWYVFELYDTYGDFEIIVNPLAEDSSEEEDYTSNGTAWLAGILTSTYALIDFDEDVNVYYNGTIYSSIEEALSDTSFDYYIAGSNADFNLESEYLGESHNIFSNYWAASVGIAADGTYYQDTTEAWLDQLTEVSDGVYSVVLPNQAVKGTQYAFGIYINQSWNAVVDSKTFTAAADAYVKVTYYAETGTYSISYVDENGDPVEVISEATTFYFYYNGSGTPVLAFSQPIDGLDCVGYYWSQYCYAVEAVSGYDNWYSFTLLDTYGEFKIVKNPGSEYPSSNADSDWIADVESDIYALIDFDRSVNVFYNNLIYSSIEEAVSDTSVTYYIVGSNADFSLESEYLGTSNNIFSNYWASPIEKSIDAEGNVEYYQGSSSWLDMLTETVQEGVYSITLSNKAVAGTKYAFNIYANKDWNNSALGSTATFTADYDATVLIEFDAVNGVYTIYYLDDDGVAFAIDDESTSIDSDDGDDTDDGDDDDADDGDDDDSDADGSSDGSNKDSGNSSGSTGAKTGDTYPIEAAAAAALIALAVMFVSRKKKAAE